MSYRGPGQPVKHPVHIIRSSVTIGRLLAVGHTASRSGRNCDTRRITIIAALAHVVDHIGLHALDQRAGCATGSYVITALHTAAGVGKHNTAMTVNIRDCIQRVVSLVDHRAVIDTAARLDHTRIRKVLAERRHGSNTRLRIRARYLAKTQQATTLQVQLSASIAVSRNILTARAVINAGLTDNVKWRQEILRRKHGLRTFRVNR